MADSDGLIQNAMTRLVCCEGYGLWAPNDREAYPRLCPEADFPDEVSWMDLLHFSMAEHRFSINEYPIQTG